MQTERNNNLLILLGFFVGLFMALLAVFFFLRKRLQQQQEEDTPIQLTQYERLQASQKQPVRLLHTTAETTSTSSTEAAAVIGEQATPDHAALVGVVSTRLYYPLETPLEDLDVSDVVYFSSEDEARSQGFLPAGPGS
ncbi:MAG: LPXTG cell wall anchor domain-containing protein [Ktedonobacteraceae bacterium]|nr:LPXTG cell wall anchor domain-containing protein [Ktedonobacteraceae bacterium]